MLIDNEEQRLNNISQGTETFYSQLMTEHINRTQVKTPKKKTTLCQQNKDPVKMRLSINFYNRGLSFITKLGR